MSFHKLDYLFDDYEMSGRTGKTKGENIKLIIERNHVDNAVYVGDTQGDYEAAQSAGVPFVFCKYGFGNVPNAKCSIDSFKQLADIDLFGELSKIK